MTDRQRALLGYLQAIRPELEGARDANDLMGRIMRCIAEDGGFVAEGLAQALAAAGKRYVESYVASRTDAALGNFSKMVQDFVSGTSKKSR